MITGFMDGIGLGRPAEEALPAGHDRRRNDGRKQLVALADGYRSSGTSELLLAVRTEHQSQSSLTLLQLTQQRRQVNFDQSSGSAITSTDHLPITSDHAVPRYIK
jgi:hypothetical protein